ncbi:MAG: nodulation protein NfeD [Nitrososphaeria archaeon]
MSKTSLYLMLTCIALAFALLIPQAYTESSETVIVYTDVSGYISVATVEQIKNVISYAENIRAKAVILRMNTLGGSADAMLQITDAILLSEVPVIGYVHPHAAQALSAGTYILMATDYAVMAPYATIGSAQPVLGSEPTREPKYVNFYKEKMISYAAIHGRNQTAAEHFVTENLNVDAYEAKRLNVIEAVEGDIDQLLLNANGKGVKRFDRTFILETANAKLVYFEKAISVQILGYVTDPVVSSLLLSIGIMGILIGLSTPGIGAEVVGAIMLLLGLIGFGLNLNLVSGILVIMGMVLFVVELKKGAHGVAAILGTIAITLGFALTISNPFYPTLIQSEWVVKTLFIVVSATGTIGLILTFIIVKAIANILRRKPVEWLPSGEGKALDDISPDKVGFILIGGEYWQATSDEDIKSGDVVVVTGRRERILQVKKKVG